MKKIVPLLLVFGIITACEKTVVQYSDEPKVTVANPVNDVTLEEGVMQATVDLSDVFTVSGNNSARVLISLQSIQNSDLVSGILADNILTLEPHIGFTGASEVEIRGEWSGYVAYETFIFKVTAIQPDAALNSAVSYFQNGDYRNAENFFRIVISKPNEDLKPEAYMGLGFSQMRNDDAFSAYQTFQDGLTISPANIDIQAGLSLLEYATRQNYQAAITYARSVLIASPDYIFNYDTSLDKNDLLVNIALSQYMLQQWNDCIATIRDLDPAYSMDTSQNEFRTKIFQKLEELLKTYG
jgi:hypothetical protein